MLKRIAVEYLTTGISLHERCGCWMEPPVLAQRLSAQRPQGFRRIDSGINEVWIDTSSWFDVAVGQAKEESDAEVEHILVAGATTEAPQIHAKQQILLNVRSDQIAPLNLIA